MSPAYIVIALPVEPERNEGVKLPAVEPTEIYICNSVYPAWFCATPNKGESAAPDVTVTHDITCALVELEEFILPIRTVVPAGKSNIKENPNTGALPDAIVILPMYVEFASRVTTHPDIFTLTDVDELVN